MAKSFKEALWDILQQASSEARRSNSSIRIRGDYHCKLYADPDDDRVEAVKFDVQVTPNGCTVGPNIKEI